METIRDRTDQKYPEKDSFLKSMMEETLEKVHYIFYSFVLKYM